MDDNKLRAEAEKVLTDIGFGCYHEVGICNPIDPKVADALVAFAQQYAEHVPPDALRTEASLKRWIKRLVIFILIGGAWDLYWLYKIWILP